MSASGSALVNAALGYPRRALRLGRQHAGRLGHAGFVVYVYREVTGRTLPRTTQAQASAPRSPARRSGPVTSSFQNTYAAGITHVGIALGDGRFVHARGPGWAHRHQQPD